MKHKAFKKIDDKYYINEHQYIYIDKNIVKDELKKIKFPAIIMDTEFFNRSHDKTNPSKTLYNEKNKDLVYVLQYSFAKNCKEIYERKNTKSIKSMSIKHLYNDKNYDFYNQYTAMIKSFINMCLSKGIKTLVFAGDANDKKIIKGWINSNKQLLNNKKTDLFSLDVNTKEYDVNTFDIYPLLEKGLCVSNFDKNGEEFYNKKNLDKGFKGEETIALPSLKKFFDYFGDVYDSNKFKEDEDIYKLCVSALKFFSNKWMSFKEFKELNADVKKAKDHCYNDVLKLLYLMRFFFAFSEIEDIKNKYIEGSEIG